MIFQSLQQLSKHFESPEGKEVPEDLKDSTEKIEAYSIIVKNMPLYVLTLAKEMQPSAQQPQVVGETTQDSASYRVFLMQSLNKIVPPMDVDTDNKPVDRQKEAEQMAKPGTLVLGVKLLEELGSGEDAVTNQPEDFSWLLKKDKGETIEQVI